MSLYRYLPYNLCSREYLFILVIELFLCFQSPMTVSTYSVFINLGLVSIWRRQSASSIYCVVDYSWVKSFVCLKSFSSSVITNKKSVVSRRHMETRLKRLIQYTKLFWYKVVLLFKRSFAVSITLFLITVFLYGILIFTLDHNMSIVNQILPRAS